MAEFCITPGAGGQWGRLRGGGLDMGCRLGRAGVVAAPEKQEGDGATPAGRFALRRLYYRADRMACPHTPLPATAIRESDGWCDDPAHADYNRLVQLPHPARHEMLWRADGVYDLLLVIGHNDAPPVPGLGSAIFVHLMAADRRPTEGCIAFNRADMTALLAVIRAGDHLLVSTLP